ncbi:MAG: hypothetical protein DI537_17495 [Stutzerimonas stutzeri]|nr:MAG: hypothetical protein DI537_17495 [Stutzerimonas stutzeri]
MASRLLFSQITVEEYVSNREAVRQRLLSVPVFGSSSLIELDLVLASFVERQVISTPTEETPFRLPEALQEVTVSTLLKEKILAPSLTRHLEASPIIAGYKLQSVLDDRWAFQQIVQGTRSIGKSKALTVERALDGFVSDLKAIACDRSPSRDYVMYGPADLLPPAAALGRCIELLPETQRSIIRDRFGLGGAAAGGSRSILDIAKSTGMSRYACTAALKSALAKLKLGSSRRAAVRLLAEPVGIAAQRAASLVLKAPVKDAQIENYLRDEPHLRLSVIIAYKRPAEWLETRKWG